MKDTREGVGEFDMQLKHVSINDFTSVRDIFWKMMPLKRDHLLKIVRDRADECSDKKFKSWNASHIDEALKVIIGASQFRAHTDLWSTERKGMLPPPDFGRWISKDRFTRILRYWARGEIGIEDTLTDDPWGEVRIWVNGHNSARREEIRCGSALTPDESMIAWTGISGPGGVPHLSFLIRKPEPLGIEAKCVCDGSSGVMMYVELQEGKIRMH